MYVCTIWLLTMWSLQKKKKKRMVASSLVGHPRSMSHLCHVMDFPGGPVAGSQRKLVAHKDKRPSAMRTHGDTLELLFVLFVLFGQVTPPSQATTIIIVQVSEGNWMKCGKLSGAAKDERMTFNLSDRIFEHMKTCWLHCEHRVWLTWGVLRVCYRVQALFHPPMEPIWALHTSGSGIRHHATNTCQTWAVFLMTGSVTWFFCCSVSSLEDRHGGLST